MYFILQGIMLLILSVHLGRWLFSETTEGVVRSPYSATVLTAHYKVDGIAYTNTYMRNGYPFTPKSVIIRYLTHKPSVSRINNFMGIGAEPLAWWLFFSLSISALFLTNNTVFSKGTTFQLQMRFPWIIMDEYFPIKSRWFRKHGNPVEESSYADEKATKEKESHQLPQRSLH